MSFILQDNSAFLYTAAVAFHQKGYDEVAERYLARLSRIRNSTYIYSLEGDVYLDQGKKTEAINSYTKAANCVPAQIEPKYKLVNTYLFVKDTTNAIVWANKIIGTPIKVDSEKRRIILSDTKKILIQLGSK